MDYLRPCIVNALADPINTRRRFRINRSADNHRMCYTLRSWLSERMHRCMLAASRVFIVDHFGGADATVGLRCVCVCVCACVSWHSNFPTIFRFFSKWRPSAIWLYACLDHRRRVFAGLSHCSRLVGFDVVVSLICTF